MDINYLKFNKYNFVTFLIAAAKLVIPRHWNPLLSPKLSEWVNEINHFQCNYKRRLTSFAKSAYFYGSLFTGVTF